MSQNSKGRARDGQAHDVAYGTPARSLPNPSPPKFVRLEGDDLFAWAKLTAAVAQAHANLNQFGEGVLRRGGWTLGSWVIDEEGYIIPVQENRRRQEAMVRAQQATIPAPASSSTASLPDAVEPEILPPSVREVEDEPEMAYPASVDRQ